MAEITRVLLVAADRHSRTLVAQAIDAVGDTWLTVAGSPGEARTLLNAHRYGLVIATNLGIPPWLSIDVIPIDRSYEAMFIGGYWEDDFVPECELRRLHCVRVPCDFDTLREEIAKALAGARRAAADMPGPWHGVVEALTPTKRTADQQPEGSGMNGLALDVGPEVVDFLFDAMKIDDAWSVREPRSFVWWGHRLVQRVWAEPVRSSLDHQVVRVHAATALLRNVRDTPEMRAQLAATNMLMHLGALIWVPETNRVMLHTAACFHSGNRPWLQPLFLAAVGLQVTDAHIKADGLARMLGGEPDVSAHPRSGPRPEPDDILNVIATVFAPGSTGPSPWTEADFTATSEMTPRPWVLATAGAGGMTAEFPFTGNLPAVVAGGPETALLTASSTERHPQLGSGLLLRLQLPFNVSQEEGSNLAWMLNALETIEETNTHTLGAWCLGPTPPGRPDAHSVTFVSFVPAAAYRKGLLDVLAMDMAIRTRWVASTLLGDRATMGRTAAQFDEALRRALQPERLDELRRVFSLGAEAIRSEAHARAAEATKTSQLWQTRPVSGQVQCWACRAPLVVAAETRGTTVACPRCGTKQALPR